MASEFPLTTRSPARFSACHFLEEGVLNRNFELLLDAVHAERDDTIRHLVWCVAPRLQKSFNSVAACVLLVAATGLCCLEGGSSRSCPRGIFGDLR